MERYEELLARLNRLLEDEEARANVNLGTWAKMAEVQLQMIGECGGLEPKDKNIPRFAIPAGHVRCNGPCQRVLEVCEENFRRDAYKKDGFKDARIVPPQRNQSARETRKFRRSQISAPGKSRRILQRNPRELRKFQRTLKSLMRLPWNKEEVLLDSSDSEELLCGSLLWRGQGR